MTALVPVITTAGLAAVFNAGNDGLAARITHIAIGDRARTPDKHDFKLASERRRVSVADGERVSDHQIHLTGIIDGDGPEFWVHEVGFFLEDGTLLAVWSDAQPLAYIANAVPLMLHRPLAYQANALTT